MQKISVYTILYKDLQFYEDIIQNIYSFVDEFIIIDGPYSYAIDTLKKINLFYDETNKPIELNHLIQKYPKIKYKYVICDNEEEKRMIGYNMCSNNMVLLVDTDEFLNIDMTKLNNFINNKSKYVCGANIYNMCDYNVNYNKLTTKYILFKKPNIDALEHLNYTWLIGCKQHEKNISYMDFNSFGVIYHLTLNRNKENNIIKFIFYVLLHRKNNNREFNLLDNYCNDHILSFLTIDEMLNIFIHCHKNRINIPTEESSLQIIEDNINIVNLKKYSNNLLDFEFKNEMKCLLNVPVFIRLTKNNKYILFENVKDITVNINLLYLNSNKKTHTYTYTNLLNNSIEILYNLEDDNDIKYIYIELNCKQTYDDNNIFVIKNII